MENNHKPIIGITIGDINGIGPELILKICSDSTITKVCTPIIYGSTKIFNKYRKLLNADEFQFYHIKEANHVAHRKVNIIHCWEEDIEIEPGKVTDSGGKYAYLSLKSATTDLKKGFLDALVTAPINKHNIKNSGFNFVGHTEFLQDQLEAKDVLMFMVSQDLKVAIASMHVPLNEVVKDITKDKIQSKLNLMIESLKKDFAIIKPKIAVLGLNPHAGEDGTIGKEEIDILMPLVAEMKHKGNLVFGPYPADGFFAAESYKKYDAILAMYHDQGLIPFKMLAFEDGVNFTAGLKVVRTSPDHGTAYNLAGRGTADESSFRSAIYMACDILKNRSEVLTKV